MSQLDLLETPASMKSLQSYLKIASEHDQRDLVISYWIRFYVAQTGLKLTKKSQEETNFLIRLMTWLESTKKELHDNEAITNDVAAQAHLENWALKLFLYADKNDRASNFSPSIIRSFYTAGLLYDVLTVFGELSEEAAQNRKYAKWKAAYIHNCLKNGETPVPGPIDQDTENFDSMKPAEPMTPPNANSDDSPSTPHNPSSSNGYSIDLTSPGYPNVPAPNSHSYNPTPTPTTPPVSSNFSYTPQAGTVSLSADQMLKAQKYIKWAGSAINYDDIPTSVENLQKALRLLTTGQDS